MNTQHEDLLLPRARILDVLEGRAQLVGSRTKRGQTELRLPKGMISPFEPRMLMGLRYGDISDEEAKFLGSMRKKDEAFFLARWAFASLVSSVLPKDTQRARFFLVSSPIDPLLPHEAIQQVAKWVQSSQTAHVRFVHPHALNIAKEHTELREELARADLVLPDGVGIRLGAALLGRRLEANMNGTDWVPDFLRTAERANIRVALVGGAQGVAQRAMEVWSRQFRVPWVGAWHGFQSADELEQMKETLQLKAPCAVLVGLGSPKQELFARTHLHHAGLVSITVGGLFDFVSGDKRRAPLPLRELGLEWTYRLLLEPKRMAKRYLLGNPQFLARVLQQKLNS